MPDWHIWSTEDMLTWKHERTILPTETYMGPSTDCWATEVASRNGKYYFYFSDKNRTTGVMISDSPTGPFKDVLGKPLLNADLTSSKEYDPTVSLHSGVSASGLHVLLTFFFYFSFTLRGVPCSTLPIALGESAGKGICSSIKDNHIKHLAKQIPS